ncbi:hypothetical protein PHYBOEH_011255 [Phytophthora boehmeriae]|uniref:Uncharacterized protein n=1 Tax=Phytophthora boehmeriae TaxID=109152 RepID=A0A8T1WWX7_9STRA|nr:hypothetical protein PHYBOEH_011255 [Phytophthora boehmeriae]
MSAAAEDAVPMIPPEFLEFMDDILSCLPTMSSTETETTKQETTRIRQPRTTWRKGRKMAGNVPYTTDLDRRKKSEVRALQLEIEQLSARLEQLTKPQQVSTTAGLLQGFQALECDQSHWSQVAMVEKEKRIRAEDTKHRLEMMISRQSNAIDSIRRLLRRSNLFEGREFVENLQPSADQKFLHLDFSKPLLNELSASLDRLRLGVDGVLPPLDGDFAISLRSGASQHNVHGSCFETSEVMHMPSSTPEAAGILWCYLLNATNAAQSFRIIHVQSASTSENNYERGFLGSQGIRDKSGEILRCDVLTSFHKYEEEDRVVFVGTMAWLLPAEGLQFEDKYWTVISPSPTDPTRSVLRTLSQLLVRNGGSKPLTAKQEEMMEYFGKKKRQYLQLRQDQFIEHAYATVA